MLCSQNVVMSQSVTFTTRVAGVGPFTYQWTHNGTNINGATGSNFIIANASLCDIGEYSCIVMNQYGHGVAAPAPLIVTGTYAYLHTYVLESNSQSLTIIVMHVAKLYESIRSELV